MNKNYILLILFLLVGGYSFCQNFSGSWSGVIIDAGKNIDNADIIYLKLEKQGDNYHGITRIELLDGFEFTVKDFTNAKQDGSKLTLEEKMERRSSNTPKSPNCKLNFTLKYTSETGYLEGEFVSSDCRNKLGKVIFIRSDHIINMEKEPTSTHLWKHLFVRNYKKGYPSPELMKEEQRKFKFQAIYFEHDKAEILPKFHDYLNRMARVLDGVHDLRVKITGHTDAVGSDGYNIGLSERRADAIRDYFKSRGIDPQKLVIDFKGKRMPAATNETSKGRQLNRRVVFEFI